jgi:hypothetical protein
MTSFDWRRSDFLYRVGLPGKDLWDWWLWRKRNYRFASPAFIKRELLAAYGLPGATWVETGTYKGDMARHLAESAQRIITLEPDMQLYKLAKQRLAAYPNIEVVNGTSEEALPKILPNLHGPVNFWLDGHYYPFVAMTYRGAEDTPIRQELALIEAHLSHLVPLRVIVDDMHCFNPSIPDFATYPKVEYLIDWAKRNGFEWSIECNMLLAMLDKR